jgi:hypothetical protein
MHKPVATRNLTLLDNDQVEDRQVLADHATSDRLATPLPVTTPVSAEARHT